MRVSLLFFFISSFALAQIQVTLRWALPDEYRAERGRHEATRPILVGNILYYATLSGNVYAVHREQGYVIWKKKMPAGVEGALSYGRSKLYVGDTHGNLIAFNVYDGSEAWRFKVGTEWLAPPVVQRGRVFAATVSGEIYALSTRNGKELWQYSRRGDEKMTIRGLGGPTVFGQEVYMGFADGYLVALSADKGRVIWTKKLRTRDRFYDVDTQPWVDKDSVIAGSFDGNLLRLDRLTGKTLWNFAVGSFGGVYVGGETIYFAGLNKQLYALSKKTGDVLWKRSFEGGVGNQAALAGKYLVFTTSGDPVYVVEPKSGTILWKGSFGGGTFAAATGHVTGWFYVLSNFGNLYAYEIEPATYAKLNQDHTPQILSVPKAIERQLAEQSPIPKPAS